MSKWINADSVINKLNSHVGFTTRPDVVRAIQIVQDEPGIDIVRCKDCRWWIVAMDENNSDEDYLKCNMDKWPNADDYCSYGERKESE